MSVTIELKGLKDTIDYFERLPDIANQAAVFAVNDVSSGTGLTMLRKAVYEEIDFPNGYLTKERLGVKSRATKTNMQAVIRGRDRPTSLARFASRGQTPANTRKAGVRVQVKGGRVRSMKGAWLTNLRGGNTGLAVRLKPGQRLNKTTPAVELAPNVYLLYGPSVDQVFGGVADDNSAKIGDLLADEFFRQVRRLSNG